MSDDTEPLSDDELVSAVLDGSASPAQVDRVMGDRDLATRLARFRAIGDAVAAPVPPLTDDGVDDLIANAIDRAADIDDGDDQTAAAFAEAAGPARTLPDWAEHGGPRPAKRPAAADRSGRGVFRRVPPLAAAAVLLVIAGVGLYLALSSRADRNRHPASTASSPLVAGSTGDANAAAGSGVRSTAPPASGAVWLGSFATQDELNQTLAKLDPRTLQPAPTGGAPAASRAAPPAGSYLPSAADLNRCDHVIRTGVARALTNQRAIGGAMIAGRNVMVLSYDAPASGNKPAGVAVIAADQASCYPLLEQDH